MTGFMHHRLGGGHRVHAIASGSPAPSTDAYTGRPEWVRFEIDNAEVDNDLTDFIALVDLSALDSYYWTNVNGVNDTRFQLDGGTKLPFYLSADWTDSGSTGTGWAAVRLDGTTSSSAKTYFWLKFGAASPTAVGSGDTEYFENVTKASSGGTQLYAVLWPGDEASGHFQDITANASDTNGGTLTNYSYRQTISGGFEGVKGDASSSAYAWDGVFTQFGGTGPWYMETIAKLPTASGTSVKTLFNESDFSASNLYANIRVNNNTSNFRISGNVRSSGGNRVLTTTTTYANNSIVHIGLAKYSDTDFKLYVNGILEITDTTSTPFPTLFIDTLGRDHRARNSTQELFSDIPHFFTAARDVNTDYHNHWQARYSNVATYNTFYSEIANK